MQSPPPVHRGSPSFDDNYDEPGSEDEEKEQFSRKLSAPVGGQYATLGHSRPLPPEDNYENDDDDFQNRMSNPPTLPPRRTSEKHTEKAKPPSFRAQTMPRPVKSVPPSLPSKPIKVQAQRDEDVKLTLPPTLNPVTVGKLQKMRGTYKQGNLQGAGRGSDLFKKRQELEKAIGNLN